MKNKTIVIIGATGGIGSVLARKLALEKHTLILVARNTETLQALSKELSAKSYTADMTQYLSAQECFEKIKTDFTKIDAIVNLAGSILLKPAHATSEQDWQQTIAQNLTTAFHTLKFSIPLFTEGGSVVLMSSAAARIGLANHEAIAAAKAGVIGLTKSAAATYSSKNIRVNCIAPGLVKTPLSEKITSNPSAEKASLSLHPLKRLGEAEDIVPMIEFLFSDASTWMTGQVIGLDGGLADIKTLQA